jgi:hypothetical protein
MHEGFGQSALIRRKYGAPCLSEPQRHGGQVNQEPENREGFDARPTAGELARGGTQEEAVAATFHRAASLGLTVGRMQCILLLVNCV